MPSSYEHMELMAYEILSRIAERANDQETVRVARDIAGQENEMARRLSGNWDVAVNVPEGTSTPMTSVTNSTST